MPTLPDLSQLRLVEVPTSTREDKKRSSLENDDPANNNKVKKADPGPPLDWEDAGIDHTTDRPILDLILAVQDSNLTLDGDRDRRIANYFFSLLTHAVLNSHPLEFKKRFPLIDAIRPLPPARGGVPLMEQVFSEIFKSPDPIFLAEGGFNETFLVDVDQLIQRAELSGNFTDYAMEKVRYLLSQTRSDGPMGNKVVMRVTKVEEAGTTLLKDYFVELALQSYAMLVGIGPEQYFAWASPTKEAIRSAALGPISMAPLTDVLKLSASLLEPFDGDLASKEVRRHMALGTGNFWPAVAECIVTASIFGFIHGDLKRKNMLFKFDAARNNVARVVYTDFDPRFVKLVDMRHGNWNEELKSCICVIMMACLLAEIRCWVPGNTSDNVVRDALTEKWDDFVNRAFDALKEAMLNVGGLDPSDADVGAQDLCQLPEFVFAAQLPTAESLADHQAEMLARRTRQIIGVRLKHWVGHYVMRMHQCRNISYNDFTQLPPGRGTLAVLMEYIAHPNGRGDGELVPGAAPTMSN